MPEQFVKIKHVVKHRLRRDVYIDLVWQNKTMKQLSIYLLILFSFFANSEELIFGKETLTNGMNIVFEAAPKDIIFPKEYFLDENKTDIHIEMLINWSDKSPPGSPNGGFIPYLDVSATIQNSNGKEINVKLTPHLNISDNLHYAQNIQLPGTIDDLYDVTIYINPPKEGELGIHYDWKEKYGFLLKQNKFEYKNLSFNDIALKSRR